MSSTDRPLVSAEVIPVTASGRSITEVPDAITSENLDDYLPTDDVLQRLVQGLRALQFQVQSTGPTVTIIADADLFRQVFGVNTTAERRASDGSYVVHATGTPTIPDSLKDLMRGLVFPEPPEWFRKE